MPREHARSGGVSISGKRDEAIRAHPAKVLAEDHRRARERLQTLLAEPLTEEGAVQVALLTVYDMAKALDKGMRIDGVRLLSKRGGKSGDWTAK